MTTDSDSRTKRYQVRIRPRRYPLRTNTTLRQAVEAHLKQLESAVEAATTAAATQAAQDAWHAHWMTLDAAAERFGVHPRTLQTWLAAQALLVRTRRKDGRLWFHRDDVAAALCRKAGGA